jgi:hypothetical protein
MWQYQVELLPEETKNIWLIDTTFSITPSYLNELVLEDTGSFPPIITSSTTFTLSSSDFTSISYGYGLEGDNTGFNIGGSGHTSGQAFYGPIFSQNQGGNASKANEILNYFNSNGLSIGGFSYLFNVTYGAGSTVSSGIVVVSFYYYDINNTYINIGTVDTSVPGWNTPGINPFSLTSQQGTFYLPMVLSLYSPTTQDTASWC